MPGLQFDKPRFTAEPGQEIELTFKNPDDMAHNLVFTQPGQRMAVVQTCPLPIPNASSSTRPFSPKPPR